MDMESVKCLIVGGGPAGYTAAIYAARAALEAHFAKPMLRHGFFRSEAGSAIYNTGLVKNYAFTTPAADLPASAGALYTLGTLTVQEGA